MDWIALPQFFRDHGWFTTGAGKVYHGGHPANFDQNNSWSETWGGEFGNCRCGGRSSPWPPEGHATCEGVVPTPTLHGPPCGDDSIVDYVVGKLQMAANGTLGDGKQPFLIAAGLHKPHVPFYAPQKYFALYPDPAPPVPLLPPTNMPYSAYHSCLSRVEGANFSDWGNFTDIPNSMTQYKPMEADTAAHLRRGYYASVSYTDANVGLIMDAAKPLLGSTVVVLVGDHGWSLGEQNEWCKMTNFENGVRVPLIFRAPGGGAGVQTWKLAEAVDLYKTLADLSGIGADKVEDGVDGVSLAHVVMNPETAVPPRNVSRSVFPRCYPNASAYKWNASILPAFDRTDCQDIPKEHFDLMGYSIRTPRYRYTEWRKWDGAKLEAIWTIAPNGTELYVHSNDPAAGGVGTRIGFSSESTNSAVDPNNAPIVAKLSALLRRTFNIATRNTVEYQPAR